MPRVYTDENERKYYSVLRSINGEMKLRKISIQRLARDVNIERSTLSKKLTGTHALTVPELIRITSELQIGVKI